MPTVTKQSQSIDDSVEVKTAWSTWRQAQDHVEQTTGRVKELKRILHPDGPPADELQQVSAQVDLLGVLKTQVQAMTAERAARSTYEATRHAELTQRSGPLQAKFQEAMKERERVMEDVITVDDEIRAIYQEACVILGSNQKVIPHAGLPMLDKSTGQSHWEFLQGWYRQQGIISD